MIGVGVKQSTSDLLIANCDEFIFYDDLVREQRAAAGQNESIPMRQAARALPSKDKGGGKGGRKWNRARARR